MLPLVTGAIHLLLPPCRLWSLSLEMLIMIHLMIILIHLLTVEAALDTCMCWITMLTLSVSESVQSE